MKCISIHEKKIISFADFMMKKFVIKVSGNTEEEKEK
jgi:hypothetical protein